MAAPLPRVWAEPAVPGAESHAPGERFAYHVTRQRSKTSDYFSSDVVDRVHIGGAASRSLVPSRARQRVALAFRLRRHGHEL
jgi:hypothetical protein